MHIYINFKRIFIAVVAAILLFITVKYVRIRNYTYTKTIIDKNITGNRDGKPHFIVIFKTSNNKICIRDEGYADFYYSCNIGDTFPVKDWEFYIKKYSKK